MVGYYFFEFLENDFSVMYVTGKISKNFACENFFKHSLHSWSYLETHPNEKWFDQIAYFLTLSFQDLQIEVLSKIFAHNLSSAIIAAKTSFRIYGLEQ